MTVSPDYFEAKYAAAADPWGLASRWYEQRKYAITLALLPARRYHRAFEPGCSIGVLTGQLAQRCDRLLACDAAAAAVERAARRTTSLRQVQVQQRVLPDDWPDGDFDLIVFSEMLYYFAGDDLPHVLCLGAQALRPGGTLVAVHWRHPVPDHPRGGDEVHAMLAGQPGLTRLAGYADPDFLADVYLRAGHAAVCVAQAEGLA